MKTPVPTKLAKSRRVSAVMNTIAQHLGFTSWRNLESTLYSATLPDKGRDKTSDLEILSKLFPILGIMRGKLKSDLHGFGGEINQILCDYPRQRPGRKTTKGSE